MFEYPRLGVGPIQQGHIAARMTIADQRLYLLDQPASLVEVGKSLVNPDRLALAALGPQVLAETVAVVGDDRVCRGEDIAVRAVVLLQADHLLDPEFALEIAHVADLGAAETIDRLVIVANAEQRGTAVFALACKQLEPQVLEPVGVLEFIHQNVPETRLVVPADGLIAFQEFVGAQQQFREIHNSLSLALGLILRVQLDPTAGEIVPGLHRMRPAAGLLVAVDEVLQLARRKLFVVDVEGLQQALDRRELICAVENLEKLRQAGFAVVGPEQAVAKAVEGADPHAAGIDGQHRRQAGKHLLGGLVGEGHRKNALGRDLPGLHQPGDAGGEDSGLAGTCAGKDEGVARGQRHRLELFLIEIGKQTGHEKPCAWVVSF